MLAEGDAATALPELRAAFTTCIAIGARHEAALVRLLLAEACRGLGDVETADMEEATARAALASFLGAEESAVSAAPDGLTDREGEVLRLLARGHTNRRTKPPAIQTNDLRDGDMSATSSPRSA
jgi:DNA-binding NarL/FixJ family response regulator